MYQYGTILGTNYHEDISDLQKNLLLIKIAAYQKTHEEHKVGISFKKICHETNSHENLRSLANNYARVCNRNDRYPYDRAKVSIEH